MQTINVSVDAVTVDRAVVHLPRTWSAACGGSAERVGTIAGRTDGTRTRLSAAPVAVERAMTAAGAAEAMTVPTTVFAGVSYGADHAANDMAVLAGQPAAGVDFRPRGTPLH